MTLEFTYTRSDHVPLRIEASGRELEDLLDDAQWIVDCDNPGQWQSIGSLSGDDYQAVFDKLGEQYHEALACRTEDEYDWRNNR